MSDGKISVIVPIYGIEDFLPRCIDSILDQSYKNLEIILVDDGSPDRCGAICDRYAAQDGRIRVIHKKSGGVSSARNAGLRAATGDCVGFIDGDDFIARDMYSALRSAIDREDADISVCGYMQEGEDRVFYGSGGRTGTQVFNKEQMISCMLQNSYFTCSLCDKLLRKNAVSGLYLDEAISHNEDLLFLYRVMKRCHKAILISEPHYYYCNNTHSASKGGFTSGNLTAVTAQQAVLDDIRVDLPQIFKTARKEYVRANLSVAMQMVRAGYQDDSGKKIIRANIRKHYLFYICSAASRGYKYFASLLLFSQKLFEKAVIRYDTPPSKMK